MPPCPPPACSILEDPPPFRKEDRWTCVFVLFPTCPEFSPPSTLVSHFSVSANSVVVPIREYSDVLAAVPFSFVASLRQDPGHFHWTPLVTPSFPPALRGGGGGLSELSSSRIPQTLVLSRLGLGRVHPLRTSTLLCCCLSGRKCLASAENLSFFVFSDPLFAPPLKMDELSFFQCATSS